MRATPPSGPSSRRRPGRWWTLASVLTVSALALSGCSDGDATAPSTQTQSPTETPGTTTLPTGVLGERTAWVLDQIDGDLASVDVVRSLLSEEMLAAAEPSELVAIFEQLALSGPWTPVASEDDGTHALVTVRGEDGTFLDVQVVVDEQDLIAGLLFTPGHDPERPPAADWDELDGMLEDFTGADAALRVATLEDDGTCAPVHESGSTSDALPMGSVFKLYVLGAVVDAVEGGTLTWDTMLVLTDDVKSLPSGTLQDEPAGTEVRVQDAAAAMISASDNTATDLLMATVGREAVEAAMVGMGHHAPALNSPFLSTRDLFWLGWGGAPLEGAWSDLDDAEQLAVLEQAPAGILDIDPATVTDPVWQDGLDWFATSDDLCAAHHALQEMAGTDAGAPVRDILSANPGIDVETDTWPYVAFKGGSAPGVLAGSWYAENTDGEPYLVTLQLVSDQPAAVADVSGFAGIAEDALRLAAQ
ncbi:serine hydrolase [Sanguibacter suaedae]|uniref:Serine hydrolase n=1 Tax=Sanguibacter suaedae TaxID=2795737 RepID=A0A934IAT3_9MICO|nr:serine hydrolase [Sanguibacter suaedae]MBI9113454.1 serine hydrolase [Sanguibacter suaedae]